MFIISISPFSDKDVYAKPFTGKVKQKELHKDFLFFFCFPLDFNAFMR